VTGPFSHCSQGRVPFSRIEGTYLAVDICRTAKKPEPPKPIRWNVYKIASKAVWLGAIEAPDEAPQWRRALPNSMRLLTGRWRYGDDARAWRGGKKRSVREPHAQPRPAEARRSLSAPNRTAPDVRAAIQLDVPGVLQQSFRTECRRAGLRHRTPCASETNCQPNKPDKEQNSISYFNSMSSLNVT
jgi:hypothetical protein